MLGVRSVRLREAYLRVQHSANVEMAAGTDPYMRMRTSDDSIRYQSTIYALVRVLDKTVLLARTVQNPKPCPQAEALRILACAGLLLQSCVLDMYEHLLLLKPRKLRGR